MIARSLGITGEARVWSGSRRIVGLSVLLTLVACGGPKRDDTVPPQPVEKGQSLAAAMAMMCAAPTRAEADHQFGDPGARDDVLAQHLSDGITQVEVLAKIEGWRSGEKTSEKRDAELADLLKRAGLSTPCRLVEVWANPDWGASEIGKP